MLETPQKNGNLKDYKMITINKLVDIFNLTESITSHIGDNAMSYDAAFILTRHFSAYPDFTFDKWLENPPTENFFKFWTSTSKVKGEEISNLGYLPLSFVQIEKDTFIKEDTARAAIKLLIQKGVCDPRVIKGSSNKYKMSINPLNENLEDEFHYLSEQMIILTSRGFWRDEKALELFKRMMITFPNRKYVRYFLYLYSMQSDVLPTAKKIHDDLGYNEGVASTIANYFRDRGIVETKGLGGRRYTFTINESKLNALLSEANYEERENYFDRKIKAVISRNLKYKGGIKLNWNKVNKIAATPEMLNYKSLPPINRLIIHKISKEAKKNGFTVNWNWWANNVLASYITRRSKKDNQLEGFLENANLKCIEDVIRKMPRTPENWANNFKNSYGEMICDYDTGIYTSFEEVLNDL